MKFREESPAWREVVTGATTLGGGDPERDMESQRKPVLLAVLRLASIVEVWDFERSRKASGCSLAW